MLNCKINSKIKKLLSLLAATVILFIGVVGTVPFVVSEIGRQTILHDGIKTVGTLAEIKPVQSKIFDDSSDSDSPAAGSAGAASTNTDQSQPTSEKPIPAGVTKAGRVVYLVDGQSYDILRPELPYNAKIGDPFTVLYIDGKPKQAIFEDTPFPIGFMATSVALLAVSILGAIMVVRFGWSKKQTFSCD